MSSAGLLQDLGFNIEESETPVGFILGSKQRDATSAGQVVGAVFVALLGGGAMPIDDTQTMRACVVSHPYGEKQERRTRHTIGMGTQRGRTRVYHNGTEGGYSGGNTCGEDTPKET